MLRKIHATNFFHIKCLGRTNIKCENGPVLPPPQVFHFNDLALHNKGVVSVLRICYARRIGPLT
jgi:hypothetical protein